MHTLTVSQGKWSKQRLHAWVLSQWVRRGIAVHRPQDRSCWLSATLWESTALSYAAYLNQSFYKWTFTVHAIPQSQIRPYYIPISRGWSEEGRGAKGHAFFPFTIHGKKIWHALELTFNLRCLWKLLMRGCLKKKCCSSHIFTAVHVFSLICLGLLKQAKLLSVITEPLNDWHFFFLHSVINLWD